MKPLPFYKDKLGLETEDDVFDFFKKTLKPGNMLWSYFVDWDRALANTAPLEDALNLFNCLIGSNDFDDSFRRLLRQNPSLVEIIPALLVRTGSKDLEFNILTEYSGNKLIYEKYDFCKERPTEDDIEKYLVFVEKTGLKELLVGQKIKNLQDYMIGVEAGLGSNARKNRGGKVMEDIVAGFVRDFCETRPFFYLKEANGEKIKKATGKNITPASRRFDFVIYNDSELLVIEVNFYAQPGSKLKATAGEYRMLFDSLAPGQKFLWLTDGLGWEKSLVSLREVFDHNDYVGNLAMLEAGLLHALLD